MRSSYMKRSNKPWGSGYDAPRIAKVPEFKPEKAPNIKTLDRYFSEFIHLRDQRECRLSFEDTGIECWGCVDPHHVMSRDDKATRFDPRNAVSVCRSHHRFIHDNPTEAERILRKVITSELYDELYRLSKTSVHVDDAWQLSVRDAIKAAKDGLRRVA